MNTPRRVALVAALLSMVGCGFYDFAVQPRDNPSDPSSLPRAPTGVSAVAGDGRITVSWDAVARADSYLVYWNIVGGVGMDAASMAEEGTSCVHEELANGTTYYYAVAAVNGFGESSLSEEVSAAATRAVPATPTGVTVSAGDGQITVSWDPSDGATSYTLYWNNAGSVSAADAAIPGAVSPHVHTGLTNGATYYYAVAAANEAGQSPLSSEVSATPQGPVSGVPQNVSVSAGDGQTTVSWDPVVGATSYTIYWNTTGTVSLTDTAIANATSPHVHTGLTNGLTYHYAVTAAGAAGESALSAEVSATPQVPPAGAPQNVAAVAGDGQVTVSWDSVSGATSYNVYWNTTGTVSLSDAKIEGATSPHAHTGLTNGTSYHYAVAAVNGAGQGPLSAEAGATPVPPAPAGPANLVATAGARKVTLTWDAASGADSYDIYWDTSSGVSTSDAKISGVSSPYVHEGLSAGTYYVVTASNLGGESPASAEANAAPAFTGGQIGQWWATTKQKNAMFGYSVAVDGEYAAIGARDEDTDGGTLANAGAVYLFHRTAPDTWNATPVQLLATDRDNSDEFGQSVAISGDYLVVGAYGEDGPSGGVLNAGQVYVYRRTGTNAWGEEQILTAPTRTASDYFGRSVAIDGDYAVVGADGDDDSGQSDAGAAYVFRRVGPGNVWDAGTPIYATDYQASDAFGTSVSISGEYVVVGAPMEDEGGSNAGAAYLYHRTGLSAWDGGVKILASDRQAGDWFGGSVSVSGDYAIVGAYQEDTNGSNAGAAYVFHREGTGNTWDAGTKIMPTGGAGSDWFGFSVSIAASSAVVGAPETPTSTGPGFARVFYRTGTNAWSEGPTLVASDGATDDQFGSAVATDGTYIVVGALGKDGGGVDQALAGSAYAY